MAEPSTNLVHAENFVHNNTVAFRELVLSNKNLNLFDYHDYELAVGLMNSGLSSVQDGSLENLVSMSVLHKNFALVTMEPYIVLH